MARTVLGGDVPVRQEFTVVPAADDARPTVELVIGAGLCFLLSVRHLGLAASLSGTIATVRGALLHPEAITVAD
jgi:hypothetical protein